MTAPVSFGTLVALVTVGNSLSATHVKRLEIRRTGNLKDGDSVIGTRARVKVVRRQVGAARPVLSFAFEAKKRCLRTDEDGVIGHDSRRGGRKGRRVRLSASIGDM